MEIPAKLNYLLMLQIGIIVLIIMSAYFISSGFSSLNKSVSTLIEITEATIQPNITIKLLPTGFDCTKRSKPKVKLFFSPNCEPCEQQREVIMELMPEFQDRIDFLSMCISMRTGDNLKCADDYNYSNSQIKEGENLKEKYEIWGVPTIIANHCIKRVGTIADRDPEAEKEQLREFFRDLVFYNDVNQLLAILRNHVSQ